MNDIDKLNKRIDNEGVYYAKLARRVAQLEAAADTKIDENDWRPFTKAQAGELFRQEYGPTGPRTVSSLTVTDKEMAVAASTFVRSIGTVNRRYLKQAVQDKNGDAARALYNALGMYPMGR